MCTKGLFSAINLKGTLHNIQWGETMDMTDPNLLLQGSYFSLRASNVFSGRVRCPSFSQAGGCMEGSCRSVSWVLDRFYNVRMLSKAHSHQGLCGETLLQVKG